MSKVFIPSNDSQILYHHLKDCATNAPDEVISYSALSKAIQRDVQKEARALLNTARRMAEADDGLVFATVRSVGLKLVPQDELHKIAAGYRKRAGNQARKGLKALRAVDLSKLDEETRLRTVAESTVLQVQAHAAKPATVKKLQAKIIAGQDLIPLLQATVEMFK